MNSSNQVTVFTPESALRNPGQLLREIFGNLLAGRSLAWRMFVRNIRAMYRQTMLGLFWAFLPPLANTALWVFLSQQKVVDFGDEIKVNYAIYVLTGMVLWQSFIEGLQSPLNSVQRNKSLLSKLRFPRESILMVGVFEVFFNLMIRVIVLVPLLFFFQATWGDWTILAPFAAILLVFLGVGMGCFLMPIGMLYNDVSRMLIVITPLWMILTQIVYPAPKGWAQSFMNWGNPASPLLLFARDLLVMGSTDHWMTAGIYALLALPLCLLGLIVFRVAVPILVERV